MSDASDQATDPSTAFFNLWADSFSKVLHAAMTFSPDAVPPEMLRQIRAGIFQALAKSWEEYMRSPQFLEGMKQLMDNATAFRKLTGEFLTKTRHEFQGTAREDIDSLMLAIRHLESRVLDRVDDLSTRVQELHGRLERFEKHGRRAGAPTRPAAPKGPAPKGKPRKGKPPKRGSRT